MANRNVMSQKFKFMQNLGFWYMVTVAELHAYDGGFFIGKSLDNYVVFSAIIYISI